MPSRRPLVSTREPVESLGNVIFVPKAIVRLPLDRIAEGIVGLLQSGELGVRSWIVVVIRMVLRDLVTERLLDLLLGGVSRQLK